MHKWPLPQSAQPDQYHPVQTAHKAEPCPPRPAPNQGGDSDQSENAPDQKVPCTVWGSARLTGSWSVPICRTNGGNRENDDRSQIARKEIPIPKRADPNPFCTNGTQRNQHRNRSTIGHDGKPLNREKQDRGKGSARQHGPGKVRAEKQAQEHQAKSCDKYGKNSPTPSDPTQIQRGGIDANP